MNLAYESKLPQPVPILSGKRVTYLVSQLSIGLSAGIHAKEMKVDYTEPFAVSDHSKRVLNLLIQEPPPDKELRA